MIITPWGEDRTIQSPDACHPDVRTRIGLANARRGNRERGALEFVDNPSFLYIV
jgi:hypothetical protein